jgi:hypothetical protein
MEKNPLDGGLDSDFNNSTRSSFPPTNTASSVRVSYIAGTVLWPVFATTMEYNERDFGILNSFHEKEFRCKSAFAFEQNGHVLVVKRTNSTFSWSNFLLNCSSMLLSKDYVY